MNVEERLIFPERLVLEEKIHCDVGRNGESLLRVVIYRIALAEYMEVQAIR